MADDDDGVAVDEPFVETRDPEAFLSAIRVREVRVDKLLGERRVADALRVALTDPPFDTRDGRCKDANWEVVLKATMAIRNADDVIPTLRPHHCDTLMKYLYRGLETGNRAICEQFLRLHEKLTQHAGVGCIVRTLVDRKNTV